MALFAIQKIVKNGNSWQITIPRKLLHAMELFPGEYVKVELLEDGWARFRKFKTLDENLSNRAPGIIEDRLAGVER